VSGTTWRDFAACLSIGPEPFFPETGQSDLAAAAKQICGTCPVVTECLNFAFATGADYGIFGGLTAHERRHLLSPGRGAAA
jgi:WhiB family transcriptional regulator, redox-sensing transcriptional regulator